MATMVIGMKPPKPPGRGGSPSPKMQPPAPPMADTDQDADNASKGDPKDCVFISSDKHCGNCGNYSPETGSCAKGVDKVYGPLDPEAACIRYFKAIGDGDMDEADQMPDANASGEPDTAANTNGPQTPGMS